MEYAHGLYTANVLLGRSNTGNKIVPQCKKKQISAFVARIASPSQILCCE